MGCGNRRALPLRRNALNHCPMDSGHFTPSLGAASIACKAIAITQIGSWSRVVCHYAALRHTAFAGRLSMSQWR